MWKIVVPVILGIIVIAIACAILFLRRVMRQQAFELEPDEFRKEGGPKRALLLYHPTRHTTGSEYARILAEGLHARGYDVTVNYASKMLTYDPNDYELLIFGTGAYMGMASSPVRRWLKEHRFHRKQVVLYSVGMSLTQDPEIGQLRAELEVDNIVYQIKVSRGQEDVLEDFVKALELDNPDFDSLPDPEEEEEEVEVE